MNKLGKCRRVQIVHFAKNKEILPSESLCRPQDRWNKTLPELVVHMLHRVQAESGDREVLNPIRIDFDHAPDNPWLLRKQIVEPRYVPVLCAFAPSRGFAAIMVNRRIVEPIRYLNLPIFFVQEGRRHWEAGVRVEWWKILPVDVIAIIKWLSVPVQVRLGKFVLIVVDPILRLDNVRSVVDHNVEDRPYPATFCLRDQVLEIFLRSEVRINVGKVQNPITMIPRSRRSP